MTRRLKFWGIQLANKMGFQKKKKESDYNPNFGAYSLQINWGFNEKRILP
jgi:hypothetical protein